MPRQNSDPTSDTPGTQLRDSGREERDRERDRDKDRDRTAWLKEEDFPPKVRNVKKSEEQDGLLIHSHIAISSHIAMHVSLGLGLITFW